MYILRVKQISTTKCSSMPISLLTIVNSRFGFVGILNKRRRKDPVPGAKQCSTIQRAARRFGKIERSRYREDGASLNDNRFDWIGQMHGMTCEIWGGIDDLQDCNPQLGLNRKQAWGGVPQITGISLFDKTLHGMEVLWSGRLDLNQRPQRPERCALPG
jgi:hypothetical protein